MIPLSTVIMTFNEEDKIERCILSVKDISDEILLVDSFSTDKTVEIAKSYGAKIISQSFLGYIGQRAFCVENAEHDFILALDADEYLSPELSEEIKKLKENPTAEAYFLNRLSAINGYFLKYTSWFPHHIIRLFFRDAINCKGNPPHDRIYAKDDVKTDKLKGLLMHHCNEDIHDRMATVNKHSTIAAQHRFENGKKSNYFRILIKPIWKFIVEYILRLGFLDGFYGLLVSKTTAYYIYLRESKLMELNKKKVNK